VLRIFGPGGGGMAGGGKDSIMRNFVNCTSGVNQSV
jgi:hypothetical protein